MDRRRLLSVLNVAIAMGLAVVVVWTIRPWELWRFDRRFLFSAALALTIDVVLVLVWARRHALVLAAAGSPVPPMQLVPLVTFSNAANNLTPAATGEVARAWFLNRRFGVPIPRAGGAIGFERVFMFGFMALTALLAGMLAVGGAWWLIASLVITNVGYVLAVPRLIRPMARRTEGREMKGGRVRRALVGSVRQGLHLWANPATSLGTAGWSVLSFACQGAVFWLAASLTGISLSISQTWAVLGGATVAGVLSALPFGLGAAELTSAGIGSVIGLDPIVIASSFVLYRLFLTFPLAIVGSYHYGRLSTSRSNSDES